MAATAALFDGRPERALVFLKRLSKRYVPTNTDHLLHALALAQQNKFGRGARVTRTPWTDQLVRGDDCLSRRLGSKHVVVGSPRRDHGATAVAARQQRTTSGNKATSKPAAKARPAERSRKAPARATADRPAPLPGLPLLDIDIPFEAELDLAPLLAATQRPPKSDGRWFRLRERFTHLSLAQGFDELLCLPHPARRRNAWHQVETVRKVLKQFRGRVLLADEVGLGKTIEAGMVLKEYALRGMAERILILTPASLVGQWRDEMESKFGLAFATSHDPLLRADPVALLGAAPGDRLDRGGAPQGARRRCSAAALRSWSSWTRRIICATTRAQATGW